VTRRKDNDHHTTRSQSTERVDDSTVATTTTSSFASHHDASNFNVRDYLIERCVTDTNPAVTDNDDAVTADDDVSDDVDGDVKVDSAPSWSSEAPRSSLLERSSKPPAPSLQSQRFSDSELIRRTGSPAGSSATLPAASCVSESRAKRHRWKLLRKALNLFSLDEEMTDADIDTALTAACDDEDAADEPEQHLNARSISVESLPGSVPAV